MASHPIGITVGVMQILTVCQRPFLFSPRVLSFTLTHVFFYLLSSNVTFTAADIFSKSFHLLSLEIWFYHLNTIQWTSIYFGGGGQTVAWSGMSLTYISGIFNLINWCVFWIMYFNHWNNSLIWIMLHFAIFLNTRCAQQIVFSSFKCFLFVNTAFQCLSGDSSWSLVGNRRILSHRLDIKLIFCLTSFQRELILIGWSQRQKSLLSPIYDLKEYERTAEDRIKACVQWL